MQPEREAALILLHGVVCVDVASRSVPERAGLPPLQPSVEERVSPFAGGDKTFTAPDFIFQLNESRNGNRSPEEGRRRVESRERRGPNKEFGGGPFHRPQQRPRARPLQHLPTSAFCSKTKGDELIDH